MIVTRLSPLALLPALLAAGPAPAQQPANPGRPEPRAIVLIARRAVEGDSVVAIAARWHQTLARDSTDRDAALGLASLARFTYHHDEAQRRFATLVAAPGTSPDAITTAALLGWAWNLNDRGYSDRTDSLFGRARAEAHGRHDLASEAEALAGMSLIRASQFGEPKGVAALDTAARLLPPGNDEIAGAIGYRRALLSAVVQRPTATAEALACRDLARRIGAPRLEALALRALALGQKLRGQFDSSLRALAQAETLERAAHEDGQLAITLARHADIYHTTGDLGAFRHYVLAGRRAAATSGNMYAAASSNIALALIAIQLHDDGTAAQYLAQAAALNDTLHDRGGVAQVQAFDGLRAADVGDFARARTLLETARTFRHSTGDPEEFEISRDLVYIDILAGDLPAAAAALSAAEDAARHYHLLASTNFDRERGRLALATGDMTGAMVALSRAVHRTDTADHVLRYGSRALLAEAYAQAGQLPRAARELGAADDELDAWRATLTDSALRPFVFQVSSQEIDGREAGPAVVVAAMARGGAAADAFVLAERRRARELADRLVQLDALRETPTGAGNRAAPATDPRRAAALTSRRISADSVAAALPTGTALLEFVAGAHGAPTTLFAVGGRAAGEPATSTLHAFLLPSADSLSDDVARLVALLESGEDAAGLERTLGASLLDDALATLGPDVTRVIIVPDGPLHRLPFDALRTKDHSPLAVRYAVSIAPSAAVWDALRRRSPARPTDPRAMRLLALANPAFAPAPSPAIQVANGVPSRDSAARGEAPVGGPADVYRGAFDSTGGLPPLPASAREARVVAEFAPRSEVRLGADATGAYLEHAPLDDFGVIHIATHALVDERSIARTALALAPSAGASGFVTPSDLAALHLRADLVVLSACRTAGGVVIDGEGVQGLTGPLLVAGARSVIATQWRIRDKAVLPFIERFYSALAAGLPVGDALQTAKRDAIARGAPAAEWATFTIVGDPMTRIPLTQPGPVRLMIVRAGWPVAVGLALFALIAVGFIAWVGLALVRMRRGV